MIIFVTGSSGFVGRVLSAQLNKNGHHVQPYDIKKDNSLLDKEQLDEHIQGAQIVIHCAYASHSDSFSQDISENIQMITNLLDCCIKYQIPKLIFLSSLDVTGVFKGERAPDYFPIDENHPTQPSTSYGIHKLLSEKLCELTAKTNPIKIIILRPPGIWNNDTYNFISKMRIETPEYEYDPFWEYGAFIDVRDLVDCIYELISYEPKEATSIYNIAAKDITTSGNTTKEWLQILHPEIPFRDDKKYQHNPYSSLINCSKLKAELGWEPKYTWARFLENYQGREKI
jgi:UDP-glucose 4-epimerase